MNNLNQTMTPQKQRIAIAEACGWKISNLSVGRYCWSHPRLCAIGGPSVLAQGDPVGLPDYLNDLNAMHEAEGMLLAKCGNDPQDDLWVDYLANLLMAAPLCLREHATAAQRAEAFLKTIGKWEDSQ
jgi:hypothetical protein